MKKIAINLNPQKENVAQVILQNISSYAPLLLAGFILVLAVIIVLQGFAYVKLGFYSVQEKEWEQWKDKDASLREVKKQISDLKASKKELLSIVSPKYIMGIILGDIFSSLPQNIWFDSLILEKDSISISGYVVKWQEDYLVSLDKFINSLREKSDFAQRFSKIDMNRSYKVDYNGAEVLKFSLECRK